MTVPETFIANFQDNIYIKSKDFFEYETEFPPALQSLARRSSVEKFAFNISLALIIPMNPSTSSAPTRKIISSGNSKRLGVPFPGNSRHKAIGIPLTPALIASIIPISPSTSSKPTRKIAFFGNSKGDFLPLPDTFFDRSYFGLISFFGGSGIFSMKPSSPTALTIPTSPSRSSMLTRRIDSVGNSKGLYLPLPGNSMPSDIGIFFTPVPSGIVSINCASCLTSGSDSASLPPYSSVQGSLFITILKADIENIC
uniref:Uncharacterized protein n=1 Tax=Glossina palpalis gambiensis TaxID=67801 RepID=A0A1B0BEJ8_9MUSC